MSVVVILLYSALVILTYSFVDSPAFCTTHPEKCSNILEGLCHSLNPDLDFTLQNNCLQNIASAFKSLETMTRDDVIDSGECDVMKQNKRESNVEWFC